MENMVMKVNFFATLRPIVGQKTVELSLPKGTTAIQLVRLFVNDYPDFSDFHVLPPSFLDLLSHHHSLSGLKSSAQEVL